MRLVVVLSHAVVRAIRSGDEDTAVVNQILKTVAQAGLTLEPMNPTAVDDEGRRFFWLNGPEDINEQGIRTELLALDGVEGVYSKPEDEAPM